MLTVFGGIYLFFLVESLLGSTAVIWRRLKSPKNDFDLDHDFDQTGETAKKRGKRRRKNRSVETIPEAVEIGPASSASSINGEDSVFVISHKALRRTLKWDPHRRRHVPSGGVEVGRNGRELEAARDSTTPDAAKQTKATPGNKGSSSVSQCLPGHAFS